MKYARVWLEPLGNSRRPPNELFSSLPIYFCSLFNQLPPLAVIRPPLNYIPPTKYLKSSFFDAMDSLSTREPDDYFNKWQKRKAWRNTYVL